jgi:biotin carboxyl carrier protein/GAF domain-containing protein
MSESIQSSSAQLAAVPQPTPVAPVLKVETNPIGHEFREAIENSDQLTDVIRAIAELACQKTECLALWISQRDPASGEIRTHSLTDDNAESVAEVAGDKLPSLIQQAMETGILGSVHISENHRLISSAVAINIEKSEMALTGCFVKGPQNNRHQQLMMKVSTQAIEQWIRKNEFLRSQKQAKVMSDALSLCGMLDRSTSKREAANYLVNHLRRVLGVAQVVYCDGARSEKAALLAVSEVEQFDPHSESSRVILSAGSACIGSAEPVVFSPAHSNATPVQTLALEGYCKSNRFTSCACFPTFDHEGNPIGSMLVASNEDSFSEFQLNQLKQFATINGTHLDVVRRANLGASELIADRIKGVPKKKWFQFAWKGLLAASLLMCVPYPYRIACECEIQPVTRRFVSAPYTGPLERSVVRPGEVVFKDQVLAYMDGKQLQLELTGVEAEHQAARRRHSSALAQGEVAQSQIARSEMRKLQTKVKSLKDQLQRLEIRSPYDGIVVSGDLDKAQGATMEIGQTLFEVAPLDAMLAEVAIPESEVQYVKGRNSVAIKLNAFPYRTFYGTINSISPGAELIEDESVFVADVKVEDEEAVIRPGMKGNAKVKTSWRPIGWNLFHSAYESVRCWTIW